MDDLDFLKLPVSEDSTATLIVLLPDSTVIQIHGVSPFAILDRCPLLYHAFEFGAHGVRQASIEATSRSAVVSLLRFLYTGAYPAEDQLPSLLCHAEAFKIAGDYDVPELQVCAYVNFTKETEFACSLATPPPDLSETVRFLYHYLASQQSRREQSLLDTLLHFCLATFTYQRLGESEEFRQAVYDTPAFHRDLCKTSMQRDFQDDGALDIVRLPVCRPSHHSRELLDKRVLDDTQNELWQELERHIFAADDDSEVSVSKRRKFEIDGVRTLVHRPKDHTKLPFTSESESDPESSSDDQGFMLVCRPKADKETVDKPPVTPKPKLEGATVPDIKPELLGPSLNNIKSEADTLSEAGDWLLV